MAIRSVPWVRSVSDAVSWRQDQALSATIYILRETGPTGFLLKEEGEKKKFKVFLGDPHKCTCSVFVKEKDLCKHICWVLLKKFRVDRHNDLSFQRGLVEREINEILRGHQRREDPLRRAAATRIAKNAAAKPGDTYKHTDGREALEQREITEEDVCPICQDELLGSREPVTYCRFGCAKSTHIKCMKVWADHQKSTGETVLKCPLCREDFGPIETVEAEYRNATLQKTRAERADIHMGITCNVCNQSPISGKCYKCATCLDYHLCQNCFGIEVHTQHSFKFRQKPNQRWRPVQRGSGGALPTAVMSDLQNREITDEDYDTLLQLDNAASNQVSTVPESVVKSFHVETVREGSGLLSLGTQCRVCLRSFAVGQLAKRLPCRHKFHAPCIDQWLLHEHPTCPIDGTVVWNPAVEEMNRQAKKKKKNTEKSAESIQDGAKQENGGVLEIVPGIGAIRLQGRGDPAAGRKGRGAVLGGGRLADRGGPPGEGDSVGLSAGFQLTGLSAGLSSKAAVQNQRPSSDLHIGNVVSHSPSHRSDRSNNSSRLASDAYHAAALRRFPSREELFNQIAGTSSLENRQNINAHDTSGSDTPQSIHSTHISTGVQDLHIGVHANGLTNQKPPSGSGSGGRGMIGHRPPAPARNSERTSGHVASIPLLREAAMTPIHGLNHYQHGSNSAPSHLDRTPPLQDGGVSSNSPAAIGRERGRVNGKKRLVECGGRRARSSSIGRNRSASRERRQPQQDDKFNALESMFLGSATGQLLAKSSTPSTQTPAGIAGHHPRSKVRPAGQRVMPTGGRQNDLTLAGNALNALHLPGLGEDDVDSFR